jgi:TM2 domain-containing membrane protein YozV
MSLATTQGSTEPPLEGSAPESTAKKRHPIGAALLSFVTPGLGQLYNAQPKKAVVIYLSVLAIIPVLSLTSMVLTFYGAVFLVLVTFSFYSVFIFDAAKNANRLGIMTLRKYNRGGFTSAYFLFTRLSSCPFSKMSFLALLKLTKCHLEV